MVTPVAVSTSTVTTPARWHEVLIIFLLTRTMYDYLKFTKEASRTLLKSQNLQAIRLKLEPSLGLYRLLFALGQENPKGDIFT